MPTEPVVEPLPASREPVERQMVDLFFDRVPFGLAVFDLDGRLQRCNRTWTGFYEHYFGAGPDYTAPGRNITDLIPGNETALEELFGAVRAGQVVRQAARRIEIPGVTTYWDVVFAPLFDDGELVGVLDVVTDATDRVQSTERLEARVRAFTHVAAAMTVDQPLQATLEQIRSEILHTTAATACSIVAWQGATIDAPALSTVTDPAFGPGYAEAFLAMYIAAGDDDTTAHDVEPFTLRRGARTDALADPRYAPMHPFWSRSTPDWEDASCSPSSRVGSSSGSSTSTFQPVPGSATTTPTTCWPWPTTRRSPSRTRLCSSSNVRPPARRSGNGSRARCCTTPSARPCSP